MGVIEDIKSTTNNLFLSFQTIQQSHDSLITLLNNSNIPKEVSLASESLLNSQKTFNTYCHSVLALVEQLECQHKEVAEREVKIREREKEIEEKVLKIKEKEYKLEHLALDNKKEREVQAIEVAEHNKLLPHKIKLNARGTRYSFVKKRLLNFKGSYLEQFIMNESQQLSTTGEIFVDRDPQYVVCVIDCFVKGTTPPPPFFADARLSFMELDFFQVPFRVDLPLFLSLLDVKKPIEQWLPSKKFELLYKASRDGFQASDFHALCDNKGPTLTLICSTNYHLFGGFTPLSWESQYSLKSHPDMFLFTLLNPHNIPPTKYPLQEDNNGMECHGSYGPSFSSDIFIANNSDKNKESYSWLPEDYKDVTGKGRSTFDGSERFSTKEIEVYSVM